MQGTPTDCVMLALGAVLKDAKPDLILSGVNRGGNLAEDVTYSGTVSAAMEGCLAGIRSIALSQVMADYTMGNEDFTTATTHGADIIRRVGQIDWPAGVLININFPPVAADKVAGVRAGLIHDVFSAHQGVEDDDMNVFCLGGKVIGSGLAVELIETFLAARFSNAVRHRRRLTKVVALETDTLGRSSMPIQHPLGSVA